MRPPVNPINKEDLRSTLNKIDDLIQNSAHIEEFHVQIENDKIPINWVTVTLKVRLIK